MEKNDVGEKTEGKSKENQGKRSLEKPPVPRRMMTILAAVATTWPPP